MATIDRFNNLLVTVTSLREPPIAMSGSHFTDERYRRARFLTSATHPWQFPADRGYEIAFAGRSNVGKSSVINTICQKKGLAKTSKTPGRTQMINFFQLDQRRRLVDLPGYGYAKGSSIQVNHWQRVVDSYLRARQCLRGIVLVMDIRRPPGDHDLQMLAWCKQRDVPTLALLNKADKLKYGAMLAAVRRIGEALEDQRISTQPFSALKRTGMREVSAVLDHWFD